MTFLSRLREATAPDRRALFAVPQIVDGLSGRISRETYLAYLAQAYHHVRHTVSLLELARSRMDPARGAIRTALERYIEEERGHEEWILNDIAAAGGDAEQVRASAPNAATSAMLEFAYHAVGQGDPVGLFGMIFVLEDTSAAIASRGAAQVAAALGLGPECFSYLASHGDLDQQHMQFFANLVDGIDDPVAQQAIVEVARNIYRLFADLFRSIPHDRGIEHAI